MLGRRLRFIAVVGAVATTIVAGALPAAAAEGDLLREGTYTETVRSRYFANGPRDTSWWFELERAYPEDRIQSDERIYGGDEESLKYTLSIRARKKSGARTACAFRALVWVWRGGEWTAALDTWTSTRSATNYRTTKITDYALPLWMPTSMEVATNGHCRNVTVKLTRVVPWAEYEGEPYPDEG